MFTGSLYSVGSYRVDPPAETRNPDWKKSWKPAGPALSYKQEITPAECLTLILFFTRLCFIFRCQLHAKETLEMELYFRVDLCVIKCKLQFHAKATETLLNSPGISEFNACSRIRTCKISPHSGQHKDHGFLLYSSMMCTHAFCLSKKSEVDPSSGSIPLLIAFISSLNSHRLKCCLMCRWAFVLGLNQTARVEEHLNPWN